MYSLFQPSKWRYERKFVVVELSEPEIEDVLRLHPFGFSEIYHKRRINNIYFDTIGLDNYFDNVTGNSKRLKVRVRWYGDTFGDVENPVLEIKIKEGLVSSKISYSLSPFSVSDELNIASIRETFRRTPSIPEIVKLELLTLNFSLLNSYKRKYFESYDRKYRVTIDYALQFYGIHNNYNSFLVAGMEKRGVIVELKYDYERDAFADSITSHFPFRIDKSSKYISGVDLLAL